MRQRWGTVAAAAILVLAVWEIAVLWHAGAAAPSDGDWAAAAGAVDSEWQDGDLVVFAPRWVDPVGRKWLGHRVSMDDAARMDAARYGRIWEVSIRGARAKETKGAGKPVFDRTFGRVRVRRYERPPAKVLWAFHERAEVFEVAHEPHRCVRLGMTRRDADANLGRELVVYAGLADVWSRRDNRAYVDLVVRVDGTEVSRATIGNDSGWLALPVATTTPGRHKVTFEASINQERGNPKKARIDLCVAAEARE